MADVVVVIFKNDALGTPKNQVVPESFKLGFGFPFPPGNVTFVNTRPCQVTIRFKTEILTDLTHVVDDPFFYLYIPPNQIKTVTAKARTQDRVKGDKYKFIFDRGLCPNEGDVGLDVEDIDFALSPFAKSGDDPHIIIG